MTDQSVTILDVLAAGEHPRLSLSAGDKLFLKGETADCMYVVNSGMIEVLMYGRVLERVGPGGIVGEMALIDGNARCAAALTETATELIAIGRDEFLTLVRAEPTIALAVLKTLARRLRHITTTRGPA